MHLKVELVTPKKAAAWLETNPEKQRHLRKSWVNQVAASMERGEFDGINGECILLSGKPPKEVLENGQHRLNAIIKANKSIRMGVIHGVSPKAFMTMDQGYRRNMENFYQIAGVAHSKVCSQVAKWLFYAAHSGNPLSWSGSKIDRPVEGVMAEWALENHPDIPEVLEPVHKYLAAFQKLDFGTKNHLAFCYYAWHKQDPLVAWDVVRYLATGEGKVPKTIVALRNYLTAQAKADRLSTLPGTKRGLKIINALNVGWLKIHTGHKHIENLSRCKEVGAMAAHLKKVKGQPSMKPVLINVD